MSARLPRSTTVSAWAALAAIAVLAITARAAAEPPNTPQFALDVLLTISRELPEVSRHTLAAEAARIWQRERVTLRWPAVRGGAERPDAPLRVLVIARAESAVIEDERWAVAELVPHADGRALALASISGARRVLDAAATPRLLELPVVTERRLGLVLGRAIAHEIGHFLLATATHADRGLMRATIDASEFAAFNGDSFALDRDASRWIRARLRHGLPPAEQPRTASFSYTTR